MHLYRTPPYITHREIIEKLSKDLRFKSICKQIAKRPFMAEELYQEFFLSLCEIQDNRLIEANEGKYLDVLCVGIINNIWGKRHRVKTYSTGSTHPLYELESHTILIGAYEKAPDGYDDRNIIDPPDDSTPYDVAKDIRSTRAVEHMKELVQIAMDSKDQSERFRARVFHYSKFKYKNTRQFSKASGIPYNVCLEAYNNFKEKIKSVQICRIS